MQTKPHVGQNGHHQKEGRKRKPPTPPVGVWTAAATKEDSVTSASGSVVRNSCNPMDYTIHGILQAGILEWVAFPFSRGSSQPRDWTQVSHIAGGFFTSWATREAQVHWSG